MFIEKLADTERHLDVSKGHSLRAEDKTDELKQLNRSIFRPVITFNKDAKRAAQEAKIQARYDEEREEREKAMRDIRETQDRLGRAATYGMRGDEEGIGGGSGRFRTASELQARKSQRSRYQFEADEEDDQLEDELDDNLDEILDVSKRLKALGTAMNSELDSQIDRLGRITDKADKLDYSLYKNTQQVCHLRSTLKAYLRSLSSSSTGSSRLYIRLLWTCTSIMYEIGFPWTVWDDTGYLFDHDTLVLREIQRVVTDVWSF